MFTKAEEEELARRIRVEKGEGVEVERSYIKQMAFDYYEECHPRSLRSVTTFACSPQWITHFRLRNQFNTSRHYVRDIKPPTPEERSELEEKVAMFQLELQDARQHQDEHYVVNGDEMFAKNVEHPRTSWGVVGEQNIIRSDLNVKNGITTTPFVSAAGDKLPTQVIAKGTTCRCVDNRHLPPDMAGDFSAKGWQTEATFIHYIERYLVPYFGPEGGTLVVDEYSAHKMDAVRMCCNQNHIDLIVVPPGLTHALQPLVGRSC